MIVKSVQTKLTVGGTEYPITNYNLQLNRSALPQLSVKIPMGGKMTAKGMEGGVDVSDIKEGQDVVFHLRVGNELISFYGVVKRTSTNVQLSATGNSSGTFSLSAEHKLAKIGGLPVLSRAIVGNGKQGTTAIDYYRKDVLKGFQENNDNTVIGSMLTAQTGPDGFTGMLVDSKSMPEFVIDLLIALYKTEDQAGGPKETLRALETDAIAVLEDLKKNIVGGTIAKLASSEIKGQSCFVNSQVENISKIWGKSNALDILRKMLNDIFFGLMPKLDGDIAVRQYCPVYAKEKMEIASRLILGIQEDEIFDATPVVGIRLRQPGLSNDFFSDADTPEYIQYPDDKNVTGLYQYIETSQYDMWFLFSSDYTPNKEAKGVEGKLIANVGHPGGVQKLERKNENAEPPSYDGMRRTLSLEIGKAVYALQKWRNSSIVLRIAYEDAISIGDIVKIDLTKAKAISDKIPKGVYFGFVEGIVLAGQSGNVSMSVQLTHVRNEDDNKEFGLQEYPIYDEPAE